MPTSESFCWKINKCDITVRSSPSLRVTVLNILELLVLLHVSPLLPLSVFCALAVCAGRDILHSYNMQISASRQLTCFRTTMDIHRRLRPVHLILSPLVVRNVRIPPQGSRSGQGSVNLVLFHTAAHVTSSRTPNPLLFTSISGSLG